MLSSTYLRVDAWGAADEMTMVQLAYKKRRYITLRTLGFFQCNHIISIPSGDQSGSDSMETDLAQWQIGR